VKQYLVAVALLGACASTATPDRDDYPFSGGGKGDGADNLPVQMAPPIAGWFTQDVDHDSAAGTFAQRYWYSTEFARGPDSPVIFYFCGEAACDPWYATSMADSALALHASVVVLEHRYYGASLPYPDETLEHMKYLTIHNALEDAATFERYARANLPLAGKWIAVGGSYPGMLAAFYRETHPELVVGAWASSAPVDVSLSFWGYDTIVTTALGETCAGRFRVALGAAEDAYNDPDRRDVVSHQISGHPAYGSLADYLQSVSYVAEGAAQYGQQAGLCASLANHRDQPLDGVIAYVAGTGTQPHAALAPGKVMPVLAAPAGDNFAGAEWFYQVCSEVGFYQTHSLDQGHTVMSWLIDEAYWADQCQTWVGTQPAIAQTRASYVRALDDSEVSNVLFVNGTLDPWSALSYTSQALAPDGITVATIAGGSHCSDLENLQPSSKPDVFAVHQQFYELALAWLK